MPKDNGKKRRLGMPTAVDRVIQQAIAQTLTPIHERQSSEGSCGFRPRKGGKRAFAKATGITSQGCHHAADMDLERFFDTAGHAKLTGMLQRTIKDDAAMSLIHKYLNAGVMANGKYEETREGTPQGGPPSPLLANIPPNELDKELERRGHPFVRHADDGLIFCKGRRAAGRVKEGITKFIGSTPRLRVNREKTESAHVGKLKFHGCGFYIRDGKCRLRLHQKIEAEMRRRLKAVTSRSNGMGTPGARPRSENICGVDGILQSCRHGQQGQRDRQVVAPPNPHVHMESMETSEDAGAELDQMRNRQMASLRMGQYKQGI